MNPKNINDKESNNNSERNTNNCSLQHNSYYRFLYGEGQCRKSFSKSRKKERIFETSNSTGPQWDIGIRTPNTKDCIPTFLRKQSKAPHTSLLTAPLEEALLSTFKPKIKRYHN